MTAATGTALLARGRVVRAGRTLIVTSAEVLALSDAGEKTCACMQQTIMVVPPHRAGPSGH